jgi:hypothetical protein
VVARVKTAKGSDWNLVSIALKKIPDGVHDLIVTQVGGEAVEIDWVSFGD